MIEPEASKAFQRVTRYLNTIERSWRKSIGQLEKLQAARREEAAQNVILQIAAQRASQPPISNIGFVSQASQTPSGTQP